MDIVFDLMCVCVLLYGKEIIVKSWFVICFVWMEEGIEFCYIVVVLMIWMCFYLGVFLL